LYTGAACVIFRHLTESKIYNDTKAKDQLAMGEKLEPTAQAEAIVPLPAAITAVVKPSLNIGASLAALWEFKYVLIGTASTWFLMDGALYQYVYLVMGSFLHTPPDLQLRSTASH